MTSAQRLPFSKSRDCASSRTLLDRVLQSSFPSESSLSRDGDHHSQGPRRVAGKSATSERSARSTALRDVATIKIATDTCFSQIEAQNNALGVEIIGQVRKVTGMIRSFCNQNSDVLLQPIFWDTPNEPNVTESLINGSEILPSDYDHGEGEILVVWLFQRCLSALVHVSGFSHSVSLQEPGHSSSSFSAKTYSSDFVKNTEETKVLLEDISACILNTTADRSFGQDPDDSYQMKKDVVNLIDSLSLSSGRSFPAKFSLCNNAGLLTLPDDPFESVPLTLQRPYTLIVPSLKHARSFTLSLYSLIVHLYTNPTSILPLTSLMPTAITGASAPLLGSPFYVQDSVETEEAYVAHLRLLHILVSKCQSLLSTADYNALGRRIFDMFKDFITEVVPRSSPIAPARTVGALHLAEAILSLRGQSGCIDAATFSVKQDGDKIASCLVTEKGENPNILEILASLFLSLPIESVPSINANPEQRSSPRLLVTVLAQHLRQDVSLFIAHKKDSFGRPASLSERAAGSRIRIYTDLPAPLNEFPEDSKNALEQSLDELVACFINDDSVNQALNESEYPAPSSRTWSQGRTKSLNSLGKRKHASAVSAHDPEINLANSNKPDADVPAGATFDQAWIESVEGIAEAFNLNLKESTNGVLDRKVPDKDFNVALTRLLDDASSLNWRSLKMLGSLICIRARSWQPDKQTTGSIGKGSCLCCDTTADALSGASSKVKDYRSLELPSTVIRVIEKQTRRFFKTRQEVRRNGDDEISELPPKKKLAWLWCLKKFVRHSVLPSEGASSALDHLYAVLAALVRGDERSIAVSAGCILAQIIYRLQRDYTSASPDPGVKICENILSQLELAARQFQAPRKKMNSLLALSQIARIANDDVLARVLRPLVNVLGNQKMTIRGFCYNELIVVANDRKTTPYKMFAPFMPDLCPTIVGQMISNSVLMSEFMSLIVVGKSTFLRQSVSYALPKLILNNQTKEIDMLSKAVEMDSQQLVLTEAGPILCQIFLAPKTLSDRGYECFSKLLSPNRTRGEEFPLQQTLMTCVTDLLTWMVIELGNKKRGGDNSDVISAITRVSRNLYTKKVKGNDRSIAQELIQNHLIGILAKLNETLGRSRSTREKRKILFSLGEVIKLVGKSMASAAPQIMTTLQSALEVDELRLASLTAWSQFTETLHFNDVGVHLGQTSAAFVRKWPSLSKFPEQKKVAMSILDYLIIENGSHMQEYMVDVSDMSSILELSAVHDKVLDLCGNLSTSNRLENLAQRSISENDAVSIQALAEMRSLLVKGLPSTFLAGNAFDPTSGHLLKNLLQIIVRGSALNAEAKDLALSCLGTLGAVDPDRIEIPSEEAAYMPMSNFEDENDSVNFVCYLLEHVLVGAYRSTNDTVHQMALAHTIKGLATFCNFDSELLVAVAGSKNQNRYPAKTIERWKRLPKFVVEAITPLFGSSFTLKRSEDEEKQVKYPIYSHHNNYPSWITIWAIDLIDKTEATAAKVFRPFRMILSYGDVRAAQQMLPHLALNAILSNDSGQKQRIADEMITVLKDHLDPKANYGNDSRLLCAQTVFDLMDHLGAWMRRKRTEIYKTAKQGRKTGRSNTALDKARESVVNVESTFSAIPLDLMADAAFKCKAYARALLSVEKRLAIMCDNETGQAELQPTYERLHEIYAALDEPDGMEGVSTKIFSPSVAHRIREHESTGQWTSAQSCWEIQLQLKPNDVSSHIGLLQCLDNLGHYDSMRTHLVGVLMEHPGWRSHLAPFEITVALAIGDWGKVDSVIKSCPELTHPRAVFGKVTALLRTGNEQEIELGLMKARDQLGAPLLAAGKELYNRVYDGIVQLHMLHELQLIHSETKLPYRSSELQSILNTRFQATSPAFRTREAILNMRRVAFRLGHNGTGNDMRNLDEELGGLWLSTSKVARKANHVQTAYSAILQAEQLHTPMTFLQNAKLLKVEDQTQRAIQEIDNALNPILPGILDEQKKNSSNTQSNGSFAKAVLQRARWMHEADRFLENEVVTRYLEAIMLAKDWESPFYHLGHYYDELYRNAPIDRHGRKPDRSSHNTLTCRYFSEALQHGTKYIYQAMPRMLTIWLDMGDNSEIIRLGQDSEKRKGTVTPEASGLLRNFEQINKYIDRAIRRLPKYQWLTVFPQVVSRIIHRNHSVFLHIERIIGKVLLAYPQQAIWAMASVAKSTITKRAKRCLECFERVKLNAHKRGTAGVDRLLDEGQRLVDELLKLCNHPIHQDGSINLTKVLPSLLRITPCSVIIPLQSSLTVDLPSTAAETMTHNPFPHNLPTFQKFFDEVEIMASLVKPRKLQVLGSDGQTYSFLCKPKDDLRKDSRLMEFNSMINKLLKKNSESRKRRLYIRTYAVVPLNEECGLIEWVPNTVPFRTILLNLYGSRGIQSWNPQIKAIFDNLRVDPSKTAEKFQQEVLKKFPPLFHEWFVEQFPEPNAWLKSRLAYGRTIAVMSIVGFVLGLGDRHCENILFDSMTGDTVHVDFNCLFDKGRTFEVPELVPFRLTQNIVDGLGVTGVEGTYRKASEVTMRMLRENKDSLTSVMESFVHDPLVEWSEKRRKHKTTTASQNEEDQSREARKALEPIGRKLKGLQTTAAPLRLEREASCENQVESLIREATSFKNLGSMYIGWCPFF